MRNHLSGLTLAFLALEIANIVCALPNLYRAVKQEEIVGDPGEPLFLTPLIEGNKIDEARTAAEVNSSLFLGVKSFSGYFTVNDDFDSNLFFWFFPSESDYENDPVVLWLQGGPGATSLFGLFEEHGPFSVNDDLELELREHSWTKSHSIIYMDNPVGTGYSFSSKGGYAQNQTQIGKELYSAVIQFFTMFPELQKNEFFVIGETYGGKYVPAVSYKILQENPEATLKINLKGLAIGDGYSDPIHMLNYGDYLFQLGLVDSNTRQKLKENEKEVEDLLLQDQFEEANAIFDLNLSPSLFYNATGFENYKNYLQPIDLTDDSEMEHFVQLAEIRSAIHVGSATLNGEPVVENLSVDIMQSVAPWISELLSHYRVLFYNGQLDIVVAYPLTVNILQHLEFDAAEEYKIAERHIWRVDDEIAGYVKQAGNLTEVLVRNAGHMVPLNQPKWAADLITRFTRNQSLYEH
ncbi:hypothetical protein NQ318_010634 [Aromia moschata]|uniref:Carboxypeptidase n=1 Tax=Aromia moschata TaxID=1265417 RepID=A0AAV8XAM3_9CUCU|nr:hypothetical protein NQ318_010634 [Aromia moschata]